MNILCTICSDLVNQGENIHATKCGHMFHYKCLIQWIERSRSCPQCRNKVTAACTIRVYPETWGGAGGAAGGEEPAALVARLDDAALRLRELAAAVAEKEAAIAALTRDLHAAREATRASESRLASREGTVRALRDQLAEARADAADTQRLRVELAAATDTLATLQGLQKVLNACNEEVEQMVQGYGDLRTLATFAVALKRALCEAESKKKEARDRAAAAARGLREERARADTLAAKLREAEAVAADAEAVAAAAVVAAETATVTGGDGEGTAHDCDVPIAPASPPPAPAPAHNRHTTQAASDRDAGDDDGDGGSPYLRLRRGAPALSLAGHKHINLPTRHGASQKADSLSIFGSRGSVAMGSVVARDGPCRYDGLGGQTRDWRPPSPGAAPRPAKLPRLTARHRLRPPPARPSCPPSHNISDMMQRIAAKDK